MNKFNLAILVFGLLLICTLNSCLDDDYASSRQPTALVTVRPVDGGSTFFLQLNDTTVLHPINMKSSPFGNKELRALVNYTEAGVGKESIHNVNINWIDSILTKNPVPSLGLDNDSKYGNDALDIINDWVTIAEDGYLTLRIRTQWGQGNTVHQINLLTGINSENPYELELRHNANGDVGGNMGDALIAFNLNNLPHKDNSEIKIKLNWKSFNGNKSTEFTLHLHSEK